MWRLSRPDGSSEGYDTEGEAEAAASGLKAGTWVVWEDGMAPEDAEIAICGPMGSKVATDTTAGLNGPQIERESA